MLATRILLGLSALAYGGIGIGSLLDPVSVAASVGVALDDVGAIEFRAMYGGLELGLAGFLGWCALGGHARAGLAAAASTFGGLGLVRLVSWLTLRPPDTIMPILIGIELGSAAAAAALLVRRPR